MKSACFKMLEAFDEEIEEVLNAEELRMASVSPIATTVSRLIRSFERFPTEHSYSSGFAPWTISSKTRRTPTRLSESSETR